MEASRYYLEMALGPAHSDSPMTLAEFEKEIDLRIKNTKLRKRDGSHLDEWNADGVDVQVPRNLVLTEKQRKKLIEKYKASGWSKVGFYHGKFIREHISLEK